MLGQEGWQRVPQHPHNLLPPRQQSAAADDHWDSKRIVDVRDDVYAVSDVAAAAAVIAVAGESREVHCHQQDVAAHGRMGEEMAGP